MDTYVDLDVVGAIEGSDKSSSYRFAWDYLRHYEALFADYRQAPINVLEIGIGNGPSLRMWQWFFTRAEITGIDINPECARHAGERVTVEIGSQVDAAFLSRVCERAPPTIIIDDGSHVYEHIIFTFQHLFPLLAPGGIYVVEDVTFHTGPDKAPRSPGEPPNAPEYFLNVGRRCFARNRVPAVRPLPPKIAREVDRVTFFGHGVAMHKRDTARDIGRGVATADAYMAARSADAGMQYHFAEWLLAHNGPNDRAAAALQAAMEGGLTHQQARLMQAEVVRRDGDTQRARAIAAEIAASHPANHHVLLALAQLQIRLGELAAAAETQQAALAMTPISKELRRRFDMLLK